MVEYIQATVDEIIPAIQGMIPRDLAEMVPFEAELDPDYDAYRAIEKVGRFRGFLAKDGDKTIGYAWYFISKHRHFKNHVWAVVDDFWLEPAYRKGRVAIRFFEFIEERLKAIEGLTAIVQGARPGHSAAQRLFEHMGYAPWDMMLIKHLERHNA